MYGHRQTSALNTNFQNNSHLQQHLHLIFGFLQKNSLLTLQEKRICYFFKRKNADLTQVLALGTLRVASAGRLKSLFVHAKYTRTHCILTKHVPNKLKKAIVIPTIRGESATLRNRSQLFHTCLQRKIGSCRGGELSHASG